MHFVACFDLHHLAAALPQLHTEIMSYMSNFRDLTIEGTLDDLRHAYRHLEQMFGSSIFTCSQAITIRFDGGDRTQMGSVRQQRALIRSFVQKMPNLRRFNFFTGFSVPSIIGSQALLHGTLLPLLEHHSGIYINSLNLDGTILNKDNAVNVWFMYRNPLDCYLCSSSFVVK